VLEFGSALDQEHRDLAEWIYIDCPYVEGQSGVFKLPAKVQGFGRGTLIVVYPSARPFIVDACALAKLVPVSLALWARNLDRR
jgi:hypothetical protein